MRPRDLALIVFLAALWGGSFLFLRMAVPEFGPVPLIALRVGIAALVLFPALLWQGAWPEFRRHFEPLFVLGVINAAVPFPLFAYATLYVSAGFAAILNSTAPLFAALVSWLWLKERLGPVAVVGLCLGFGGVVLLVGGGTDPGQGWLGAVAAALSASCLYGVSANFVKRRLSGVSSWVTTTGSFGIASLILLPLAIVQWPAEPPSATAWAAVVLLAVACTSLPNIFYFRLVLRAGPTRAMAVAFLIPAFGMLWGAIVLAEPVTLTMIGGCAVILLGTALVTGLRWRDSPAARAALPPEG